MGMIVLNNLCELYCTATNDVSMYRRLSQLLLSSIMVVVDQNKIAASNRSIITNYHYHDHDNEDCEEDDDDDEEERSSSPLLSMISRRHGRRHKISYLYGFLQNVSHPIVQEHQ